MAAEATFLSTLPARGATAQKWVDKLSFGISIHAPREGSDRVSRAYERKLYPFLSTLPARGATLLCRQSIYRTI